MTLPGLRVIEVAARIVPSRRRDEWRREWEGETAYAWQRMNRRGPPPVLSRARLRLRVLTCIIDALLEKKEEVRMSGFPNDLRYAVRGLMRSPGFALVAILTLALGIGANTAVFTLVDGVLIRPLPFEEPGQLLSIRHSGREGRDALPMSDGLYLLYQREVSSLESIALYRSTEMNMVAGDAPERVQGQVVTPSFFDVLRAQPVMGRSFLPEESQPGAEEVTILSDGLWKRAFGSDPAILGKTVDLNGRLTRIVGVMPPAFGYPNRDPQFWVPYTVDPAQAYLASFRAAGIARMAPGASVEGVLGELQSLIRRLDELFPESGDPAFLASVGLRARVQPLNEVLVGDVSTILWVLLGTVGFVLLIACANVANLLLVRAETRQRELALRLAMGAGRMEIIRFFMSESVVLAACGGALGAMSSSWAIGVSRLFIPVGFPRMAEVGVDLRVLAFTGLISLACAVFFGLFPLVRYGTRELASTLKDGGGWGATGSRARHRLRNALVVVQVAMALVLLVGAGLMFRSFQALRALDPGYDVDGVVTARVSVPSAEIQDPAETAEFWRQLRLRLEGQTGVVSVGMAQRAPLNGAIAFTTVSLADQPRGPDDQDIFAHWMSVNPGYLETLRIGIREGRALAAGDGAAGTRAVVVSESFARHWWPDSSPIGRQVGGDPENGEDWWEIVGVAADVHHLSLEDAPEEMIYYPPTIGPTESPGSVRTMDVLIRTAGSPIQFVPVLRRELQALNPRIPISNPRTMQEVLDLAMAPTSFTMTMLGAASGIALLLGLVGIYGVISYVVSQRTREIGVRMAMGATSPAVRRMVVQQGLALVVAGVILGLAGAGALSSVMASLLFGVSAMDPVTYGGVSLALIAVSTMASWIPALRAAGVDPSRALRED
ncbi:MAG: ABC transporter permease [Gemmatimonadota bacterium]|jgi:predicted permease